MLCVPIDVQQKEFEDDDAYRPSSTMLPSRRVQPDPAALEQAADLIAGSRKPVIVVGRGALWSGAGDAVRKLAARTGALIITSLMAKNWLSEDGFHLGISGSYATRTAIDLCADADCVIAVGASMNRYTTGHGYHYPSARFVQIDIKQHVLMYGLRTAECYLQADARDGVEALEAVLARRSFSQGGYRTPEIKARLDDAFADRTQYALETGNLDPRQVCIALDAAVPAEINMFTGNGCTAGFSNMLLNRRRPVVMPGYFYGCIGQMMPTAIGATLTPA
jgi:thiamine pyrophosphate-dependent acetolactate synthase large subunit-like protein